MQTPTGSGRTTTLVELDLVLQSGFLNSESRILPLQDWPELWLLDNVQPSRHRQDVGLLRTYWSLSF